MLLPFIWLLFCTGAVTARAQTRQLPEPTAPPVMTRPTVSPTVQPVPTVQPTQPVQPLDTGTMPQPIAIPGGPVAPGSIQPGVISGKPLPGGPTLWVFANPTAKALGPTSARVDWKSRESATGYRVWRNGVAIAEVSPRTPTQNFVDAGLAPGSLNTYKIWAMQAQSPPARKGDRLGALLEESNAVSVGTPAIVAPTDITASVIASGPNVVRLSWSAARGAVAYRVFRDNQAIQASLGAVTFDDGGVASGTHTYEVQSLYPAPNGAQVLGTISHSVRIRIGPFNAIAVGDSVMWGQGLADMPGQPHKFASRVRDWLQSTMGKPVALTSFAHSGAIFTPGSAAQETMITPGEVPNSFPTISHQALMDAPAALARSGISPADVDLVLVDGCINDIGITTILDPSQSDAAIGSATNAACGGTASLLSSIHTTFPAAKIVLTGYWAVVSPSSDLTAVASLVVTAGIVVGPAAAATVGIPLDPVTGTIAGLVSSTILRDKLVNHSYTFLTASNAALAAAADSVNSQFRGGWVSFVRPAFKADNAYASPDTWLWLIPTDLFPKDELYAQRVKTCGTVKFASASDAVKCVEASMGHPNVLGAQAYANAITAELASSVPVWKQVHATVQHAH